MSKDDNHITPNNIKREVIKQRFDNYYSNYKNKVWRIKFKLRWNKPYRGISGKALVDELERVERNFKIYVEKVQKQLDELDKDVIDI